jgi:adenylosuccinate lyase
MQAWAEVKAGRANPLADSLCADERITRHLDPQSARSLLDARDYVGDAPGRARLIAAKIRAR